MRSPRRWLVPSVLALASYALTLTAFAACSCDPQPQQRFRASLAPREQAGEDFNQEQKKWLKEHAPWGVPEYKYSASHTTLVREGYALSHNNTDLIADWVSYHLTKAYAEGTEERPGQSAFQPDPDLPKGRRAELSDYKGSGYDRGHQCPNADARGRGDDVVLESFYLSNMTPQEGSLNQQGWAELEKLVRKWAISRKEVWVITGPAFIPKPHSDIAEYFVIGKNEVAVPTHYYKIIISKQADGALDSLAFLVPHAPLGKDDEFDDLLKSIDEIERYTGLDFLSALPDDAQQKLESKTATELWK